MKLRNACLYVLIVLAFTTLSLAKSNFQVLTSINGIAPNDMVKVYLLQQVKERYAEWEKDYEKLIVSGDIPEYQFQMRNNFIDAIGGFPQRTPLNAKVTGTIKKQGYKIEKVIFESQPNFYVTAALFLPDNPAYKPPYPGVVICCGHSKIAKAYIAYQTMTASLACNGIAALIFEPIDQGERMQLPDSDPLLHGVNGHTMFGVGAILLGQNTARTEIWDAMRAIDYLQSRPEVDPERIGAAGNSGGGTQSSYLMALEKRLKAAAPCCYITDYYQRIGDFEAADAEQNIFGQLAYGMNHTDYITMQAPLPILINCATKDFFKIDGTWKSYRRAKRLYTKIGLPHHLNIVENYGPHGYDLAQRTGTLRWILRWLADRDTDVKEPDIETLSAEELYATPNGRVMDLPNARNVYDLNRETEKTLSWQRSKLWNNSEPRVLRGKVRKITGIRPLENICHIGANITEVQKIDNLTLNKIVFNVDYPIVLPALLFKPQTESKSVVLYIDEQGKNQAAENQTLQQIAAQGKTVLAVDLRGIGETAQTHGHNYWKKHFGNDGQETCTAYLMGQNMVAPKTEDILAVARWLRDKYQKPIELISVGNLGVPALHAAALAPDLFEKVTVKKCLNNWADIIAAGVHHNQFINVIHGALTTYDLENLRALIGTKLSFTEPFSPMSKPLSPAK
jgi:dienelactone hydrolase